MDINKIYNMDCRIGLNQMIEDGLKIDSIITSPPYWNLRDYKIRATIWGGDPNCDHIWSDHLSFNFLNEPVFCVYCGAWYGTLGLEPDFNLFIKHLCNVFDLIKDVLHDYGTCWVNIGDTYGGSGNSSGHTKNTRNFTRKTSEYGASKGNQKFTKKYQKCLLMIPQRFAIEMINRGWILRNTIIWQKPNPMPSSAKDRFAVNFEYVYFFVKNKKYFFNQQFEPISDNKATQDRYKYAPATNSNFKNTGDQSKPTKAFSKHWVSMRNKRAIWTIPTKPCTEAHFAVFPDSLVKTPIIAGCPRFICKECGKPRVKLYKETEEYLKLKQKWKGVNLDGNIQIGRNRKTGYPGHISRDVKFAGYTDCSCDEGFRPGIVLDPFAGIGTALLTAWRLGRNFIGFEISKEYYKIAKRKLAVANTKRLDEFIMSKNKKKQMEA